MELKFLLILASLSLSVVSLASASPLIKLVTYLLENGELESGLPFLNLKKEYVAESEIENPFRYIGAADHGVGEVESGVPFLNLKNKYVAESKLENPFRYIGAADHDHHDHDLLNAYPNDTLFFLQKHLHEGNILNLVLLKTTYPENLLPRKIAESIPFSSKYIPEIFEKFSVEQESKEAENIKTTLQECECVNSLEDKYCATSLESMVDFTVSKLGRNIQAIATDAHEQTPNQKYTIERAKRINWEDEAVVCHKQNYPYAVFYCHALTQSEAFSVRLVGENGGKIEVAAVCHMDTSAWDAEFIAFKALHVKPGDMPICHFLPDNHILWIRK